MHSSFFIVCLSFTKVPFVGADSHLISTSSPLREEGGRRVRGAEPKPGIVHSTLRFNIGSSFNSGRCAIARLFGSGTLRDNAFVYPTT